MTLGLDSMKSINSLWIYYYIPPNIHLILYTQYTYYHVANKMKCILSSSQKRWIKSKETKNLSIFNWIAHTSIVWTNSIPSHSIPFHSVHMKFLQKSTTIIIKYTYKLDVIWIG